MGGEEEEEEWDDEPTWRTEPVDAMAWWPSAVAEESAADQDAGALLEIRFQSRDYSLPQFSRAVLNAEAMIRLFATALDHSARTQPDENFYRQEQIVEQISVYRASLNSPLEIVYILVGAATAVAFALNRWISVKKNWEITRAVKAKADDDTARSRVTRAEAEVTVKRAELEGLALDFVKQQLVNEIGKDYDSLPPKHPLRKLVTRTVSALAELEGASTVLQSDRK